LLSRPVGRLCATVLSGPVPASLLRRPVLRWRTILPPHPMLRLPTTMLPGPVRRLSAASLSRSVRRLPATVLSWSIRRLPGTLLCMPVFGATLLSGAVRRLPATLLSWSVRRLCATLLRLHVLRLRALLLPLPRSILHASPLLLAGLSRLLRPTLLRLLRLLGVLRLCLLHRPAGRLPRFCRRSGLLLAGLRPRIRLLPSGQRRPPSGRRRLLTLNRPHRSVLHRLRLRSLLLPGVRLPLRWLPGVRLSGRWLPGVRLRRRLGSGRLRRRTRCL
jgi:hypothetical protein